MRLTTKAIENASPDSKPYKLADGGGLCLLISTTGAKLWRSRYRFDKSKPMSNNTILFALYRLGYKGRMTGHGFRRFGIHDFA